MDCSGNSLADWEDGRRLGCPLRVRTTREGLTEAYSKRLHVKGRRYPPRTLTNLLVVVRVLSNYFFASSIALPPKASLSVNYGNYGGGSLPFPRSH